MAGAGRSTSYISMTDILAEGLGIRVEDAGEMQNSAWQSWLGMLMLPQKPLEKAWAEFELLPSIRAARSWRKHGIFHSRFPHPDWRAVRTCLSCRNLPFHGSCDRRRFCFCIRSWCGSVRNLK